MIGVVHTHWSSWTETLSAGVTSRSGQSVEEGEEGGLSRGLIGQPVREVSKYHLVLSVLTPLNLRRWKILVHAICDLCQPPCPNIYLILCGCPSALEQESFTWWHEALLHSPLFFFPIFHIQTKFSTCVTFFMILFVVGCAFIGIWMHLLKVHLCCIHTFFWSMACDACGSTAKNIYFFKLGAPSLP